VKVGEKRRSGLLQYKAITKANAIRTSIVKRLVKAVAAGVLKFYFVTTFSK